MNPPRSASFPLGVLSGLSVAATLAVAWPAEAQIKEPGAHPDYSVELEPHFVLQHSDNYWGDTGIGLGGRASIPLMQNGPIPKINNNLAIGFGLDWAHFSGNCWGYYYRVIGTGNADCSANTLWFPAVVQWNFFFTPVVSAYTELGLAIEYWHYNESGLCPSNLVRCTDSGIDVEPMFAVGPRFVFSDSVGILLRIGWPYITAGATFLL